ncbi:hypothetical protein QAD02_004403, partial [Eretmocerus hayati]
FGHVFNSTNGNFSALLEKKEDIWQLVLGVADLYQKDAWTESAKLNASTLHLFASTFCKENSGCKINELLPRALNWTIFKLPNLVNRSLTIDEESKLLQSAEGCRLNPGSNIRNVDTCLLGTILETLALVEKKAFTRNLPMKFAAKVLVKTKTECNSAGSDSKVLKSYLDISRIRCFVEVVKSLIPSLNLIEDELANFNSIQQSLDEY